MCIRDSYEADEIFFTKPGRRFPSRTAIKGLITELRRVLFPGYFGPELLSPSTRPSYLSLIHLHPTASPK